MPRPVACALACALIAAAVALAAPVPHHLMKPPVYYFPTKVGTKLEYKDDSSGERTLVVTHVADRGGAKVVTLGRELRDGSTAHHATMAVTGTGLYRTARDGLAARPGRCG